MEVKCPYCGCHYKIDPEALPKPLGDFKKGYGWWLRCCRCHEKWWLRNMVVQLRSNPPTTKIDIREPIPRPKRINKRIQQQKKRGERRSSLRTIKYAILIILFLADLVIAWFYREDILNYFKQKIELLADKMAVKLRLQNVYYSLKDDPEKDSKILTVRGTIISDNKEIVKLSGIKITVFDSFGKKITFWQDKTSSDVLFAGETLDFSSEHLVPLFEGAIKVEVSIF